MAIAALGVHQRGVNSGVTTVIRQVGASTATVGRAFTYITLTTPAAFSLGETLTGASTATAIITKVISTTAYYISMTFGTAFSPGELVTGSVLTSHISGIGMAGTGAGTFAPEPTAASNQAMPQDRALSFRGALYCAIGTAIFKLIGSDWTPVHVLSPFDVTQLHCKGGLHVFYVNNQPILGLVWGGTTNGLSRSTTIDGTTWSDAALSGGSAIATATGVQREVVWNNVLYMRAQFAVGTNCVQSWNPQSDAIAFPAGSSALPAAADLIAFQNELLLLTQLGNNHAGLQALRTGSWQTVIDFSVEGSISGAGATPTTTAWGMWGGSDGFLYLMYAINTGLAAGWIVKKIQGVSGVYTDVTPNTGPGLTIGPTVLAGTGIPLWTLGGATNDPEPSRIYVVVDDVSAPGTPSPFVFYATNAVVGTSITVLQFIGPGTAVTNLGASGDIANALPNVRLGGGDRLWTPGQPDILITNITSAPAGETFSYLVFGGSTRSVQFWFAQNSGPPRTQCTLNTPTGGGTLNISGKQVDSVPADGVTLQTIKWASVTDGATNLTRVQVEPVAV